jgi:prophage antirepressor-like protein
MLIQYVIQYSMNFQIIKNKTLNCELQYIEVNDETWFKGKTVASVLGYTNPQKAIRDHVDVDDKQKRGDFEGVNETDPLSNNDKNTILITESGLYCLIFKSQLPTAKAFTRWVTHDVLPSIRRNGKYQMDHKPVRKQLTFEIKNEFDLHTKVVNFINCQYPECLMVATLGELQDTPMKRINSKRLGYQKGVPDIIINNLHKTYNGFAIEFKTPTGKGIISEAQSKQLTQYGQNNYKTLVSNDYDQCIVSLIEYFANVRVGCQYCCRKFKSTRTLGNHQKSFHRIKT